MVWINISCLLVNWSPGVVVYSRLGAPVVTSASSNFRLDNDGSLSITASVQWMTGKYYCAWRSEGIVGNQSIALEVTGKFGFVLTEMDELDRRRWTKYMNCAKKRFSNILWVKKLSSVRRIIFPAFRKSAYRISTGFRCKAAVESKLVARNYLNGSQIWPSAVNYFFAVLQDC